MEQLRESILILVQPELEDQEPTLALSLTSLLTLPTIPELKPLTPPELAMDQKSVSLLQ